MSAICLIDTSIFVEVLNVPQKANQHSEIIKFLRVKIETKESLFLPMATIIETGNHIAQNVVRWAMPTLRTTDLVVGR